MPYVFRPQAARDVVVYRESLAERRRRSLESPLVGGSQVSLVRPLLDIDPSEIGPVFERQRKAESPTLESGLPYGLDGIYNRRHQVFPPHAIESSWGARREAPLSVQLIRPLRAGNGLWSQVWLADMTNVAQSLTRTVPTAAVASTTVVVKLYHDSFAAWPTVSNFFGGVDNGEWRGCGEQMVREYWTYEEAKSLQGTILPHSYGFYDVQLPCGDTVHCHILEYIDGCGLKEYVQSIGGYQNTIGMERLFSVSFKSFAVFLNCGAAWNDVHSRNILVIQQPQSNKTDVQPLEAQSDTPIPHSAHSKFEREQGVPVYLDFGFSGPAEEDVFGPGGTTCPGSQPRGAWSDMDMLRSVLQSVSTERRMYAWLERELQAAAVQGNAWMHWWRGMPWNPFAGAEVDSLSDETVVDPDL